MRILVLNAGSSSLKFRLAEVPREDRPAVVRMIAGGVVSGIGETAQIDLTAPDGITRQEKRAVRNHDEAVRLACDSLGASSLNQVEAVGHRVVHGGERFRQSVRLDAAALQQLEALNELAPLHNPACVASVRAAQTILGPSIPMVAVFDTAFYKNLSPQASIYAIPQDIATRHHIRRYGFHGIAHASLMEGYIASIQQPLAGRRLITLHLGNGCSITAIRDGQAVDTSMGFTPLEGLVMGTRSGDLDPTIVAYLAKREGVSADIVEQWLNERSGLLGLSGLTNNMQKLLAAETQGHASAKLAVDLFCYRARKYLGAYLAVLGGADAVIFGGGIGEHSPAIRARISEGMDWCGLTLDLAGNARAVDLAPGQGARISRPGSALDVYVVAADEEIQIVRETANVIKAR